MKVTIAKCGRDQYFIVENKEKLVTFRAKLISKSSEVVYSEETGSYDYEDEVYDVTFLREEKLNNGNK